MPENRKSFFQLVKFKVTPEPIDALLGVARVLVICVFRLFLPSMPSILPV